MECLGAKQWAEEIRQDVLACFVGGGFRQWLDGDVAGGIDEDGGKCAGGLGVVGDGGEGGGDGVFVCDVAFDGGDVFGGGAVEGCV